MTIGNSTDLPLSVRRRAIRNGKQAGGIRAFCAVVQEILGLLLDGNPVVPILGVFASDAFADATCPDKTEEGLCVQGSQKKDDKYGADK